MAQDRHIGQVLQLARELGMIRSRDLKAHNIPHSYLQRLYERGLLQRSGRGIYVLTEAEPGEKFALAEVCKRVPQGVVCLLSALRFHEIGTQSPFEVWMAIHPKAHRPRVDYPPLRIVRFSGRALEEGVEEHSTSDGPVRVYNIPKTVADCFRYRNKIGLDVALEALRSCWRKRAATMDELWYYAAVDKVSTVMKPYLESLV
ncbi:MAG TPA: type IV toxin-antitoxin system AbiEi family antitoxin domain-containing protein [Chthonomonadaceae bacterium]|nr:type IV toxin-antitoxin system AbiEi family antitoxin domain-containing protein [Chthonomonadaceae bacterium]